MNYKELITETINKIDDKQTLALIYNDRLFEFHNNRILAHLYVEHEFRQTQEEQNLFEYILSLEPLFADMCFAPNSITSHYMHYNNIYSRSKNDLSIQEQLFRVIIYNQKEYKAYTDISDRKIVIGPEYVSSKPTILHEMIHVHEYILEKTNPLLKEILLLELYKQLNNKFSELDNWINKHANIHHNSNLANETGLHDLLFFLKSIDLDLQCGFNIFTTFDYNYANFMK